MTSQSYKTYSQRADAHHHPVAKKLFDIAESKQTNLVISADLEDTKSLLECADGMDPGALDLKRQSASPNCTVLQPSAHTLPFSRHTSMLCEISAMLPFKG